MGGFSRRIKPGDWTPVGVAALETNALKVVRSEENGSVIAGPGAGKTELLAQRAAYLLQTGVAPAPQRILAISFKRDAATNLGARVQQRCHASHASRLDSMTFDSFAKGLLDRFGQTLPARWRPTPDYEIAFPTYRDYDEFLSRQVGRPPPEVGTAFDVQAIKVDDFQRRFLFGRRLPADGWLDPTPGEWAANLFWQSSLRGTSTSSLSFPMIGRLVELLLRVNPMARDALRLTYSYVFMDEFQDTTQTQFDLVETIFSDTSAVVTAVGDNKQQIMRWAMAMHDPFDAFDKAFGAIRTPLYNNYRSSPDLVRIQHVLAQALDEHAVAPVSKTTATVSGESCAIWNFSSTTIEAKRLASFIVAEQNAHKLTPRDFVLLVRQKADDYANVLEPAFAAAGLSLRNEAKTIGAMMLQELLVEEASVLLISVLRLAMIDDPGRHWLDCQHALGRLRGIALDDEPAQSQFARQLDAFVGELRHAFPDPPRNEVGAKAVVDAVVTFVGRDRLIVAYPAYAQGGWLDKVLSSAATHLCASSASAFFWGECLDTYEGRNAVPLMTIHKSKGLEYHTVIFVGLDDGAWWSFAKDKIEATAGFFVAFTRAKQRVVFTYCPSRGTKTKIAALYDLLAEAGVPTVAMT